MQVRDHGINLGAIKLRPLNDLFVNVSSTWHVPNSNDKLLLNTACTYCTRNKALQVV